MASSINASLTAGLVQTADTSGILNLQSNGTTKVAVTSTGAAVTGTLSASGGYDGSLGATTPSTVVATSVTSSGNMQINGAGLIGYATGSGGAVTQATSKTTTVTLNKPCGRITMNNAALASGATVLFTMVNSYISGTSTVLVTLNGAPIPVGYYQCWVDYVDGTNCIISVKNISVSSRSDAVIINFAIINTVNS